MSHLPVDRQRDQVLTANGGLTASAAIWALRSIRHSGRRAAKCTCSTGAAVAAR